MFNLDYTMHKCSQCLLLFLFFLGFFFSRVRVFSMTRPLLRSLFISRFELSPVRPFGAVVPLSTASQLYLDCRFCPSSVSNSPIYVFSVHLATLLSFAAPFRGSLLRIVEQLVVFLAFSRVFIWCSVFSVHRQHYFIIFFPLFICFNCTSFFYFLKNNLH